MLHENRLGAATTEDFIQMFTEMKREQLQRLLVQFGYETFLPNFSEAVKLDKSERATVASPWVSSTTLARQLKDLTMIQQRQLAVAEKRLAKVETRKDPTEQLRQMKSCRDSDDRLIEEGVTLAVAECLQSASVILPSRYEYEGHQGDLDGLVEGTYKGEEVVVFIEAKHNMDSCWSKAKSELLSAHQYWQELLELDRHDPNVDETLLADYVKLCVDKNRNKKTMFAFGGAKFSETFAKSKFQELHEECLHVVSDIRGNFIAKSLTRDWLDV